MFFLVVIQKFEDSTPTAPALYAYETMDAAKSALFSTMFSSMANDNIKSVMCEIITDRGGVLKYEFWDRNSEAVEE